MAKSFNVAGNEDKSSPPWDLHWFAGLAMQAIIEKQSAVPDTQTEREEIALWAYRMAQEMIATEKRLHVDETKRQ